MKNKVINAFRFYNVCVNKPTNSVILLRPIISNFCLGKRFQSSSESTALNKNAIKEVVSHFHEPFPKPSKVYEGLLEKEHITYDEHQIKIIHLLDEFQDRIKYYKPQQQNKSIFGKLISKKSIIPKGLYLHGNVGTGKTMLMDLFYLSCGIVKKKRIHFHEFMLDVHARIHKLKQSTSRNIGSKPKPYDPIGPVAEEISKEAWLLCFDEFQVTDIADAMILKRLFGALFKQGVVMFATSNRCPDDLYKGGLQRSNFIPFITDLKEHCLDYCIDSLVDYRLLGLPCDGKVYWLSSDKETDKNLNSIFSHYVKLIHKTSDFDSHSKVIRILGRDLIVPKCFGKVADFGFDDLCMKPVGAVDYLELGKKFKVIILRDIPQLNIFRKREARRLITLIDTFYDAKVGLIISGEVEDPIDLFVQATEDEKHEAMLQNSVILDDLAIEQEASSVDLNVFSGEEEEFAFKRAVSRLKEMQTQKYWENCGLVE